MKPATSIIAFIVSLVLPFAACASEHRSSTERRHFEQATGYPYGRPGYIIDHVCPLACGGADKPENMTWQTITDAKAKDKIERKHCAWFCPAREKSR